MKNYGWEATPIKLFIYFIIFMKTWTATFIAAKLHWYTAGADD